MYIYAQVLWFVNGFMVPISYENQDWAVDFTDKKHWAVLGF